MRSRDVVACILGAVDRGLGGGPAAGSVYQSEFGTGKTGGTGTRTLMNMRDTFQAGLDAMEANEAGVAGYGAMGGQSQQGMGQGMGQMAGGSQAAGGQMASYKSGGLGSGKTGTRTLMNMREAFQSGLDALGTNPSQSGGFQSPVAGQGPPMAMAPTGSYHQPGGNQVLSGLGGPQMVAPMAPGQVGGSVMRGSQRTRLTGQIADDLNQVGQNLDQIQGMQQQPMGMQQQPMVPGGTPMMPAGMAGMGGSMQGGSMSGSMNQSPTPGVEYAGTPAGSNLGPPQPANEWQQALLSASQQGGSVQG